MERIRLYAVLLCLPLIIAALLSGCGGKSALPDYRNDAFSAVVEWKAGALSIKARVESDGQGTLRIELTEPKELSGMILLAEGERRRVSCGDAEMEATGLETLFETVGLLLPAGERRVVCETEWEGERVMYAEIEGEKRVELYLDPESGVPIGVVCGERVLRVRAFESVSSEGGVP